MEGIQEGQSITALSPRLQKEVGKNWTYLAISTLLPVQICGDITRPQARQ